MLKKSKPREILKNIGLKITRNREAVLSILQDSRNPVSHANLMESLPKGKPWDRVTIYRTLSELEEKSIIRSLLSNERVTYFELKESVHADGHSHIVCDSFGSIECIDEELNGISEKKIKGFKVGAMDILFRGKCRDCQ